MTSLLHCLVVSTLKGGRFLCSGDPCNLEPPCKSDEYMCNNGQCIPSHWKCDGHNDCIDYSDEDDCIQICNNQEFQCPDGICIPNSFLCDGQHDCFGGIDELNCTGE